jgi:propionyl-CoA synthetase
VILQRPEQPGKLVPGRDLTWDDLVDGAELAACERVPSGAPLYVLHTSGTTGRPKGVVRDNGGHAVALHHSMQALYGMEPGDVFWAASDIGWVVGHSYTVYAPLLRGCATVLYEGKPVGTPDAGAFWRVVESHGVNGMFVAPTALRAIRREDPDGQLLARYDVSSLRTLFVAGEHCDPDTLNWARDRLGIPVIDHWWQTETGWPIAMNPIGTTEYPTRPGSVTRAAPGYDLKVLDDDGREVPAGEIAHLAIRLPLPPGGATTLWSDDSGFVEAYFERFPGYYATGDVGRIDSDGYVWVLGRSDDVINVAGHRLSTGSLEEALLTHQAVAECAVVAVPDEIKGQLPIALVTLKAGTSEAQSVAEELVAHVREEIGPVASLKTVLVVERLPKTRSGKILRGTIRMLAEGKQPTVSPTIEAPEAVDEIAAAFAEAGFRSPAAASLSQTIGLTG